MTHVLKSVLILSILVLSSIAQENSRVDINISGKVIGPNGEALSGAAITLEKAKLSTQSNDEGSFSLIGKSPLGLSQNTSGLSHGLKVSIHNHILSIHLTNPSPVSITTYSQQGGVLSKTRKNLNAGTHRMALPSPKTNVYFYKVTSENNEIIRKGLSMGHYQQRASHSNYSSSAASSLAKKALVTAAYADILKVTKGGYQTFSMNIDTAEKSGLVIQLKLDQTSSLMLPQEGNPAQARFDLYKSSVDKAENILSWQLNCGGWPKNVSHNKKGKGGDGKGTFDNGATTMELTVMADAYKKTAEKKYLDAARKGLDYILKAQYPSGGWPQFYPLRGGYSDHVTFNDDAMSRTLMVLQNIVNRTVPFDTDVFTESQRSQLQKAIDGGVDYILKAQITQNGKKTVWCAQHDKNDYTPTRARAYEHPSLSGMESIEIIGFLMTQPQTPKIKQAVIAAIDWYRSPGTYLDDYDTDFKPKQGSRIWYRFYDIETNQPIFSNYDGKIHIGLENAGKRKGGYRWAGTWGETIISYADKVGY